MAYTAKNLIKIQKSYVRSKPYGDKNIFNHNNGAYWCSYYEIFTHEEAGSNWMSAISNPAYVPNVMAYMKAHGRFTLHGKPGDLVFFDWNENRVPDHIGTLIKKNSDGTYTTVEGNTSNASNGNGGCVQIRIRRAEYILGFGRPPYKSVKSNKPKTSTKKTYSGVFPKLKKHGKDLYLGLGDKGSDVKKLQKFLNWYLGHGLKVDGDFGAMTRRAVLEWQESQKLEKTGLFGKTSLGIAKKVTK